MQRDFFTPDALEVALRLLGAIVTVDSPEGSVAIRVTEVEAYHGVGVSGPYDPGSYSKDRRTERNASMFGPPGHAYVYFSYGMHFALNLVCSPAGTASGVLLRAGEVVAGTELAVQRRLARRPESQRGIGLDHRLLARGPGNLAQALGVVREQHDGRDLLAAPFTVEVAAQPPAQISSGPRVGVAGIAGGPEFPWRFWVTGDRTVSAFRPGRGAPPA